MNMKLNVLLMAGALLTGFLQSSLVAQAPPNSWTVPTTLHYQGRVSISGQPYDGEAQFKFALIRPTDAEPKWLSTWSNDGTSAAGSPPAASVPVKVHQGLYSVPLGDTNKPGMTLALAPAALHQSPLLLRVWFKSAGGEFKQLEPDQPVGAVAFALVAAEAQSLAADAVGTAQLANASVTVAKLADGAVSTEKLADGAVGMVKLADRSVTSAKIQAGAVGATELGAGVVSATQLADAAVNAAKLAHGSVGTEKLADRSVTASKIQAGAVGTTELGVGVVSSTQLADNSVTSPKLAQDANALFQVSGGLMQIGAGKLSAPPTQINGSLAVSGPIAVGNTPNNAPLPVAGTIRWNGSAFEGFDGTTWKPLGAGIAAGPRIIRGVFRISGGDFDARTAEVVSGSGFSVTPRQDLPGIYIITFETPFAEPPAITVSFLRSSQIRVDLNGSDGGSSPGTDFKPGFTAYCFDATGDLTDNFGDFSFIAIGPP